jgi:hypothetical protein
MKLFSQRHGLKPTKFEPQINDMDGANVNLNRLRIELSTYFGCFFKCQPL